MIEEKDIGTGKDSQEIARMFSEIYDVIGEKEEVYFDITHGLRNVPMLVMTILEYAKVTKEISIGGIYYGAFEVGVAGAPGEKKRVPIYDLSFYHTILSWANAANSFIKYGHADEINDLVNEKKKFISEISEQGRSIRELSGNLDKVARSLQRFTASIETGRGSITYKKGIRKSYEAYQAQQRFSSEYLIEEYYPFRELLDRIEQKTGVYKNAETSLQIGMATVGWCIDNHMVQQGYTALEETVKTFLCEKAGIPQDEEFWREKIVKRLCTSIRDVIKKGRAELDGKFEEWKVSLQAEGERNRKIDSGQIQEGIRKGGELFELIARNERHLGLISLMAQISEKRNDVNHFGLRADPADADSLKSGLKEMFTEFIKIQEEWDI